MNTIPFEELSNVHGGVGVTGAVVGAFTGAATYIGQSSANNTGSNTGLAAAIVTGAVVGFFTPLPEAALAKGAVTVIGATVGFVGGLAGGLLERLSSDTGGAGGDPNQSLGKAIKAK